MFPVFRFVSPYAQYWAPLARLMETPIYERLAKLRVAILGGEYAADRVSFAQQRLEFARYLYVNGHISEAFDGKSTTAIHTSDA